jgi:hypothetical protein
MVGTVAAAAHEHAPRRKPRRSSRPHGRSPSMLRIGRACNFELGTYPAARPAGRTDQQPSESIYRRQADARTQPLPIRHRHGNTARPYWRHSHLDPRRRDTRFMRHELCVNKRPLGAFETPRRETDSSCVIDATYSENRPFGAFRCV